MKYLTTTLQPGLIIEVEDREAESLRNDNIVVDEFDAVEQDDGSFAPPQEYADQQEQIKAERAQALIDDESRNVESPIQISREDGTMVGQPDAEQVAASEQAGQGDGSTDGEAVDLTSGEPVDDHLVESDESAPQPDTATGGKRVRRGTSARSAE